MSKLSQSTEATKQHTAASPHPVNFILPTGSISVTKIHVLGIGWGGEPSRNVGGFAIRCAPGIGSGTCLTFSLSLSLCVCVSFSLGMCYCVYNCYDSSSFSSSSITWTPDTTIITTTITTTTAAATANATATNYNYYYRIQLPTHRHELLGHVSAVHSSGWPNLPSYKNMPRSNSQ